MIVIFVDVNFQKMTKIFLIFLIYILTCTFSLNAWPEFMTLHDCMKYAVSNSTKIRIQQADISDSKLAIRDAVLSAFTPSISASTYAYYNFGRSIDPQTNTYFNLTSFHNNYSVGASINLFDGLSTVNNIKISKTGLLISQSQEKQIEADICLAVMEAFYNVLYNKRLADVYASQIKVAEKSLEKARLQEKLGQKGYADVIQMEADLADRQYDFTTAENQYKDQLLVLEALLFWSEKDPLKIDDTLPEWRPADFELESVLNQAMETNPEIKMAQLTVTNSKREYNTAKLQLLPSVSLYGGWNTSYYTYSGSSSPNFGNQFVNNGGEYIELGVTIPIYDGLKSVSKIKKKKNAYIVAQNELDQKRMDIENEVKRAIQDCRGTSVAYQQSLKKSGVQEEAYKLNLRKFEEGLISSLEFQTANDNYLKAKADEMNSLFQYMIKRAVVSYYSGIEYLNQ